MKKDEWMNRIRELPCTVIGIGISNLPLIDFLLSHGAAVTARDRKTEEELGDAALSLKEKGVGLILGENYLDQITEKLIFRSPGLRPDRPELRAAVKAGAILTSEMELFLELTPATVLAVTGSDGKTTTTTIVGKFLTAECEACGVGKTYVGGNIGEPLLPHLDEMTEKDFAVVELSSFQLQTMKNSPLRAAITNITPNHLNWHTGIEEYIEAKKNIYSHRGNQFVVLNVENPATEKLGVEAKRPVIWFSSVKTSFEEFPVKKGDKAVFLRDSEILLSDGSEETVLLDERRILLPGRHNLENYMTALALTSGLISVGSAEKVAGCFQGVAHRLEPVRTLGGVIYYNSSIDSSPTRTAAALSALPKPPIVICGGYDKKIPFAPLAKALLQKAKAVVLTGATAEKIRAALDVEMRVRGAEIRVIQEKDFEAAVLAAHRIAEPGDIVLLSPACASFDAFKNFEERGRRFKEIVNSLKDKGD